MKVYAFILLFAFCYVDCRKIVKPLDKSANIDFINMETGGYRPAPSQVNPAPVKPAVPAPAQPAPTTPKPAPPSPQVQPAPATAKPVTPPKPEPAAPKPNTPTQISPKPVNPPHVVNPITTPGPGSVKQLVHFYDSQGKASPIRPYTYSQAVKQG